MTDRWLTNLAVDTDLQAALLPWRELHPSVIYSHEGECCQIARAWFLAADASFTALGDANAPIWLRRFRPWGPAKWPSYWCELSSFKTWDCGHYAAVSAVLLERRGYEVMRVQLAQQATRSECQQWASMWLAARLAPTWVGDQIVYHEVCAILDAYQRARVWDPTENLWLSPTRTYAQAQNRGVRFVGPQRIVHWEDMEVTVGKWTSLQAVEPPKP